MIDTSKNDDRSAHPDHGRIELSVFLMTVPQFCKRYSTCRTVTFGLLKTGALKRVKIGRSTRILTESADAWARGLAERGVA